MSYTKFLRWTLLVGLAAVFIIPFIIADGGAGYQQQAGMFNLYLPFSAMFFPFITGKNFIFRILIEVLVGVYVLLALREPKYRPRASLIVWAAGIFAAWMAIATLVSVDPTKSFWSNFERMEGYLTTLHLLAYFLMVGAIVSAEEWWERLFQVSIWSSVVMSLYGLLQLAHKIPISSQSGARLDGTFGNATYLAVFMLFNIFITLFMLVRRRNSMTAQVLYGIALVLQFIVLYYTETRGALLGVIGGVVIAAIYIGWKGTGMEWRGLRKISLWGLGAIAVIVIGFLALRSSSFVQHSSTLNRIASISLSDPTTAARFQIWHMALQGFAQSPKTVIAGWGQENFNFVFNKYYAPQMYSQEQWFDRAHDQFLDWLINGGLPAFLLYVSFFVLAAWYILRSDLAVPEQAVLLGLLAAYAFNNLFVFDDLMSSVYFFLVLAFAHAQSKKMPARWMFLSRPVGEQGLAIAAPIVAVAVLLVVWTVNVPGIVRAQNLITALTTQVAVKDANGNITGQQKDPKVQLANYQTALGDGIWPGTPLGRQETTEQLLQYASGLSASTSIDPSVKQDTASAAQNAASAMLAQRKHDARLELFDGAFLDSFGQYPGALQVLAAALADSPKKQQIMFEIGVVYLNAGDNKNAVSVLQTAFNEAPGYSDARVLYASALFYSGETATADALLMQGFGTTIVDDSRLLQVYVNTKQYPRVVAIWQLRVKNNPENTQDELGLAAAYYTAGDKTNAIAALQRAAQLDPALAAQIQSVITQIQNGTLKTQ